MIVETKEQFLSFIDLFKKYDSILVPILSDHRKNIHNTELCALFIKFVQFDELYILSFNNIDCINLNINVLNIMNESNTTKYIVNKKKFMKLIKFNNLIDIDIMYYFHNNKSLQIKQQYSDAETFLLNTNFNVDNMYSVVPILKLKQRVLEYINELQNIISNNQVSVEEIDSFYFLNNTTIDVLYEIEKNGIYVDTKTLLKFFPNYSIHIDVNNCIYSEYNILTSTTRPSNSFSNLNFSALNKSTGEREFIVSRYKEDGILIYFDFEAYHLNLLSDIIGYAFPTDMSIHEYLGRQYFNKSKLTENEYNESKTVSFSILYGGIDESVSTTIPFFSKAKEYIDSVWNKYISDGYINTHISNRKIYSKNLTNMNKNKLVNYFIQNLETERNILILNEINSLLQSYDTKLIMYLYDGFLFDYKKSDGKDLFLKIKNIMEQSGKYKTKQYAGKTFGSLNIIKL